MASLYRYRSLSLDSSFHQTSSNGFCNDCVFCRCFYHFVVFLTIITVKNTTKLIHLSNLSLPLLVYVHVCVSIFRRPGFIMPSFDRAALRVVSVVFFQVSSRTRDWQMDMWVMLSVKVRNPSSQHFLVAEGLEAVDDSRLFTFESRRKTLRGSFRILLDSVEKSSTAWGTPTEVWRTKRTSNGPLGW